MFWPLHIAYSKLRPFTAATITRTSIVVALFAAFLYGDFALFRKLFEAMAMTIRIRPHPTVNQRDIRKRDSSDT